MKRICTLVPFVITFANVVLCLSSAYANELNHGTGSQDENNSATLQRHLDELRQQFEKLEPAIIYGLVVDQNTNGVPNANVRVQWQQATYLIGNAPVVSTEWTKTDNAGRFVFTCAKPDNASVRVSKDGYDCPVGSTGDLVAMKTSQVNPVVIKVRKKGAPTFLLAFPPSVNDAPSCCLWTRHGEHKCFPFDICSRIGEKQASATYADMTLDVAFDANRACWLLTVNATNGTDGVVLGNDMLYEAPPAGYVSTISLSLTNAPHHRDGVYVYLKSRSPAVYTRFRLEYDHWDDPLRDGQSLRLFCKAWVNPYGERNLEADERVTGTHWRTREELTAEAIQAIRSGRLPPKPDIERRIRETDERVAREEVVAARRHQERLEEMKKMKESERAK